jgi:hypothetical protein
MSMFATRFLLAALLLSSFVRAQDPADRKTPVLKVHDLTGANAGKEVDYAAERKERPTVYAFVRADAFDRPMARFLKKLDDALPKDAYVVAVWLTDDVDKTKDYLPRVQESLKFQSTALAYHPGEKSGPDGWGINADSRLTVVVADKGRVVASFDYQSLNETNVPEVEKALKGMKDKK